MSAAAGDIAAIVREITAEQLAETKRAMHAEVGLHSCCIQSIHSS
jgi:hypothetical protein